ncbi:hypothetical protein CTI14_71710, partial [Methylobacterium radiotolerans]
CKALKAEGYRTILVNSNPATIMTDPETADAPTSSPSPCKALKAEGYRTILVNSNPATIMTDPETADAPT